MKRNLIFTTAMGLIALATASATGFTQDSGKTEKQSSRSEDISPEPENRFDPSKMASVGGAITDVAFEPDHTRVGIRVLDEEILVYLPVKSGLAKWGLDADKLKPGVLIEVSGHSHRTKPGKVLATSAKFLAPSK